MTCVHDPRRRGRRLAAGSPRVMLATLTLAAASTIGLYWLIVDGDAVPLLLAMAASWSTMALVRALDW